MRLRSEGLERPTRRIVHRRRPGRVDLGSDLPAAPAAVGDNALQLRGAVGPPACSGVQRLTDRQVDTATGQGETLVADVLGRGEFGFAEALQRLPQQRHAGGLAADRGHSFADESAGDRTSGAERATNARPILHGLDVSAAPYSGISATQPCA